MSSRSTAPRPLVVGLLAAAAGLLGLLVQAWDIHAVGLTLDERNYFASARLIQTWVALVLDPLSRADALEGMHIRELWDWAHYWNPHPPFYKAAMALSNALAGGWMGDTAGFRLASRVWFALLLALLVFAGSRGGSIAAGLAAAGAALLMPRLLGHSFIGATDLPLATFWLAASVGAAGWASGRGIGHALLGVCGASAALATKFTALLLPIPLIGWLLVMRIPLGGWARMALLAPVCLLGAVVLNPLAWHDPLGFYTGLLTESLARDSRIPVSSWYLGQWYGFRMPWHYALVMTLVTVPAALLVLAAMAGGVGVRDTLRAWRGGAVAARMPDGLLLLAMVQVTFFLVLMALPWTPKHDGVRLFLPMFPFLALLAGHGFALLVDRLQRRLAPPTAHAAVTALALAVFYPPYAQILAVSPYYLSYYNEPTGSTAGAVAKGFEPSYWYDAMTPAMLVRMNELTKTGETLHPHAFEAYFSDLQHGGELRADIDISDTLPADWVLLYARYGSFSPWHSRVLRELEPVAATTLQGVMLVGLYRGADVTRLLAETPAP